MPGMPFGLALIGHDLHVVVESCRGAHGLGPDDPRRAMYASACNATDASVEVAWVLNGVDFAYARFDVTAIEYNISG
jgi:hypothetical protein